MLAISIGVVVVGVVIWGSLGKLGCEVLKQLCLLYGRMLKEN